MALKNCPECNNMMFLGSLFLDISGQYGILNKEGNQKSGYPRNIKFFISNPQKVHCQLFGVVGGYFFPLKI